MMCWRASLLIGLFLAASVCPAAAADSTKVLLGSWSGKATGPQGGPPTGDLTIKFENDRGAVKGTVLVQAAGGLQYGGEMSGISLKNRLFTATASFRFGENPLEALVTGPLKNRTIEGTFTVLSKGQKMGEGTFSIKKDPPRKAVK